MTKVPFVCFKFSSMYIEQNAILEREREEREREERERERERI